jgi:hypothetical protein
MVIIGVPVTVHAMSGHGLHCEKFGGGGLGTHCFDKEQNGGAGHSSICTRDVQSQGSPPGKDVRITVRFLMRLGIVEQSLGVRMQLSGHADHALQLEY